MTDELLDHIKARIASLEESKQQAVSNANACHGGICELQDVLAILEGRPIPSQTGPIAPSDPVPEWPVRESPDPSLEGGPSANTGTRTGGRRTRRPRR